jgi:hypothetical protein
MITLGPPILLYSECQKRNSYGCKNTPNQSAETVTKSSKSYVHHNLQEKTRGVQESLAIYLLQENFLTWDPVSYTKEVVITG